MNESIVFEDVWRSFGERDVLCGLSFRVKPGEVFALLGRNGAGKSTALKILLGFLAPDRGASRVLDCASRDLDGPIRDSIGYVAEGHPLYGWMRVRGAVEFEAGTRSKFDAKYVDASLKRLGLPRDARIAQLSRGQQAQLSLVFAMASDPEVLVLDDPAMGLDVAMRREFLEAMIDLVSRDGRSVLFSSHILNDVERIADRIGILHDGALCVDAPLEELRDRVQKRFVRTTVGHEFERDGSLGVLRAKAVREGFELTLLDFDARRERALRALASVVSEPRSLDLEELFLDLTAPTSEPVAQGGR